MPFEDIDEVTEASSARDVNTKLSEGWRLLAVVQAVTAQPFSHVQYVLGRKKAKTNPTLEKFKEMGAFEPPKA